MVYDPWGEVPVGWSVDFVVMSVRGMCRWLRRSILLDIRLSRAEERCMLTHELAHAERGPFPRWLTAREEAAVDADVARRLSLDALGETLAWSLHTAVARNPRPHHAPGTGAKPGLTKGFGDSSAVPGLQGRFVPEKPGHGARQVYGTVFSHSSSYRVACFRGV